MPAWNLRSGTFVRRSSLRCPARSPRLAKSSAGPVDSQALHHRRDARYRSFRQRDIEGGAGVPGRGDRHCAERPQGSAEPAVVDPAVFGPGVDGFWVGLGRLPPALLRQDPVVGAQAAAWSVVCPSPKSITLLVALLDDSDGLCSFAAQDAFIRIGFDGTEALIDALPRRHMRSSSGGSWRSPWLLVTSGSTRRLSR